MASSAFLLIAGFLLTLFVLAKPLSTLLAKLIDGEPLPVVGRFESALWMLGGVRNEEMNWRQYLLAILLFNLFGLIALFALLMTQGNLPLNPQHFPGMPWDLALNTAVSFVTNTNWQAYAGESSLS